MTAVIDIQGLTKQYPRKPRLALDGLTLRVYQGEIFGYLGPNGAGKTTTIRCMLDFVRPTAGNVHILGMDVRTQSVDVRREVGFLPSELALWEQMTGYDTLRYMAELRPGCDLRYAYTLAERLRLNLDQRAREYSTGNKRKLGIIQAMMHRPPLMILDEPTTGLDPLVRHTFNDLLREARERGQTVFLSSHVLSEVEAVCDRVGVLKDGTLRRVERVDVLKSGLTRTVTFYSDTPLNPADWTTLAGVQHAEGGRGYVRVFVTGSVDAIIKHAAQFPIDDMRVDAAGLEQVFMEFYNG